MSIATAINDLSGRIQDAYDACEAKGATMPATKNTANLSACIDSIPAGGLQGYTLTINANYGGSGPQGYAFGYSDGSIEGIDTFYRLYDESPIVLHDVVSYVGFNRTDTVVPATPVVLTGDTTVTFAATCLLAGTLISLADGTQKKIEDITYDDELLVWDFDEGRFSSAKPLWVKKAEKTPYMFSIKFASGNSIETTGPKGHRAFNIDESKFVYMNDSVGQKVKTIDGTDEVISCEKKTGKFDFYNIITEGHLNLFANGILTSCRLNNYRKIVGMKFAKPSRAFHVKADFKELPDRYVDGLHLVEQDIDKDELIKYVNRLLDNKL